MAGYDIVFFLNTNVNTFISV